MALCLTDDIEESIIFNKNYGVQSTLDIQQSYGTATNWVYETYACPVSSETID